MKKATWAQVSLAAECDKQSPKNHGDPEYPGNRRRESTGYPGRVARQNSFSMNRVVPNDCQDEDRDFELKGRVEIVMIRIGGRQEQARKSDQNQASQRPGPAAPPYRHGGLSAQSKIQKA